MKKPFLLLLSLLFLLALLAAVLLGKRLVHLRAEAQGGLRSVASVPQAERSRVDLTPNPVKNASSALSVSEPISAATALPLSSYSAADKQVSDNKSEKDGSANPEEFVSKTIAFPEAPSVFEFEIKSPEAKQGMLVYGVALTREGKILTLARYFTRETIFIGANNRGHEIPCAGWLARDEKGPWIVLKTYPTTCRAAQLVDSSYLAVREKDVLCVALPANGETRSLARTVIVVSGSTGSESSNGELWVRGEVKGINPGLPVLNRYGHLIGLVDRVDENASLVHVIKSGSPLPVLGQAALAEKVSEWKAETPRDELAEAFPAKSIPSSLLQDVLVHLNGDELMKASDKLLRQYSTEPAAWYAVTVGYAHAGRNDYALASATRLKALAPESWQSWYLYGQQLSASAQYNAAIDAFQEALERNGPVRRIGLASAQATFSAGDFGGGIESLKRLVDKDPDYFEAWTALGSAYLHARQTPLALKAYVNAASLNPQSIVTWDILATIYDNLHNWKGSAEIYTQLSLLTPGRADIWYNLGLALLNTRQPELARVCFEKVKAINPADKDAARLCARLEGAH
jgi:tetratricopeptide (TPR) repeat protein